MAKAFGWDLDYIEKLPWKTTSILIECMNVENEKERAQMSLAQTVAKFGRR